MGGTVPPTEIAAWCSVMDDTLSPWEYEVIRYLSDVFLTEKERYKKDENLPPPYLSEEGRLARARHEEAMMDRALATSAVGRAYRGGK